VASRGETRETPARIISLISLRPPHEVRRLACNQAIRRVIKLLDASADNLARLALASPRLALLASRRGLASRIAGGAGGRGGDIYLLHVFAYLVCYTSVRARVRVCALACARTLSWSNTVVVKPRGSRGQADVGEYLREEDSLYAAAPGAVSGPTQVSEVEGDNGLVRKPQRRPKPSRPGPGAAAGGGARGGKPARGGKAGGPKAKRARTG
jgi:hypothetical protein